MRKQVLYFNFTMFKITHQTSVICDLCSLVLSVSILTTDEISSCLALPATVNMAAHMQIQFITTLC